MYRRKHSCLKVAVLFLFFFTNTLVSDKEWGCPAITAALDLVGSTEADATDIPDTSPAPFYFIDLDNVTRNALIESNQITVTGIDSATPISVSQCSGLGAVCGYSLNGAPYAAAPGMVTTGDLVRVRLTSSDAHSATTHLTLTIGDENDTFSVTTIRKKGDVDGNGKVNLEDAALALKVLSGLPGGDAHWTADVNGDGHIGLTEVGRILQSVSGLAPDDSEGLKIALSEDGTVQSTVTVENPGDIRLVLPEGTRIAVVGAAGEPEAPLSLDNVRLALVPAGGPLHTLPEGIGALSSFRIVLTIDGVERDAWFWPSDGGMGSSGGLLLSLVATDPNLDFGTLGLLFRMSSGRAVQVGSSSFRDLDAASPQAFRVPLDAGSEASGSGSAETQFSPDRTGSYTVGGSPPGSGTPPEGAFWSTFTVPDPGCIDLGSTQVCGPSRVDRIEITEESTADILGMCSFGTSDTAMTGPVPDGYRFWCTRSQSPSGGTTEIKVYSMQANLPIIHAYINRISNNWLMWETYHRANGGLNGHGGPYADPYQKKEFEFAGFKRLTFKASGKRSMNYFQKHALQPLQQAGYEAVQKLYDATGSESIYRIDVYRTLDGRVLMEDDVILKENWRVLDGDETYGNRGTYKFRPPSYSGGFVVASNMGIFPWTGHGEATWTPDEQYGEYGEYVVTATLTPDQTTFVVGDAVCTLDKPDQSIEGTGEIKDFTNPPTTYWVLNATWSATCKDAEGSISLENFLSALWGAGCAESDWATLDAAVFPERLKGTYVWKGGCPAPVGWPYAVSVSWDFMEQKP